MLELSPDDESPAVVNLLIHGGRLSAEALPATVLDLAGRQHLTLDEISPGEYLCRLSHRSPPVDGLTPYEQQVWTLLRDRAEGGTVPADALTLGASEESPDWWRAFQRAVVAAANEHGLTGNGGVRSLVLFFVAALAVTGLFAALGTTNQTAVGFAFLLAVALGGFLTLDRGSIGRVTLNRQGRALARRWTDEGAALGASGGFHDVPPSGTAIWGRDLGYAAALGLAPAACRGLPLGPERARRAWVRRGGLWVLARVRYPRHLPPGWGRTPAVAALLGAVGVASSQQLSSSRPSLARGTRTRPSPTTWRGASARPSPSSPRSQSWCSSSRSGSWARPSSTCSPSPER